MTTALAILCASLVTLGCAAERGANTQPVRNAELRAFDQFAQRQWPASSEQHGMTVETLKRMFAAIDSVVQSKSVSSPALSRQIEELRSATAAYEAGSPGAIGQASRLRELFISSAAVIDEIVISAGVAKPGVDPRLTALGRAADSLDYDITLLRQGDNIERFFRHASEVLKRLDGGA